MSKPTVSVIMTSYNLESYIADAIESILTQTLSDFELIIIDDASSDETLVVIGRYEDPRIRLIKLDKNSGSGSLTRNHGLSIAKGRYVAIADGDDISVVDRLEMQVSYLEAHPSVDLLGGGLIPVAPSGRVLGTPVFKPTFNHQEKYREALLNGVCILLNNTMMFRRGVLNKTGSFGYGTYVSSGDTEFQIRASRYCELSNLRKVLIFDRQHSGSVTRRFGRRLKRYHHKLFALQELIWTYTQCGFPTMNLEREREEIVRLLNGQLEPLGVSY